MSFEGPFDLGGAEAFLIRTALAVTLYDQFLLRDSHVSARTHPVGLARAFDRSRLANPRSLRILRFATIGVCVAYAAGVALPLAAGWLAAYVALFGALAMSQGGVGHASQAMALVLVVQALALIVGAGEWSLWNGHPTTDALAVQTTALNWAQQALIATYFTAGITKLRSSSWLWVARAHHLLPPFVKAIEEKYQEGFDERAHDRRLAWARWLGSRRWRIRAPAAAALFLELASPLFLASPATAACGGLALIAFHRINGALLGLHFPSHQRLALVLLVMPLLEL